MVLRIKRGKPPYMLLCLLIAAWLCLSQVLGSMALILPCLAAFLLLTAVAAYKGFATPILLFFLPWSPLLKTAPGTLTFYTIALGVVCIVCLAKRNFRLNVYCVLCAILIFALTLLSKMIDGSGIANSYILFIFLLALFPVAAREIQEEVDFEKLTLFFAVGIAAAALSSQWLLIYPRIARYIDVHTLRTVTRFCGYYGDPNFYSAHISAALSGVLLVFPRLNTGRQRLGWAILLAVLLYSGFLSVSKSFLLVTALTVVLYLYKLLRSGMSWKRKLLLLVSVAAIAGLLLVSGVLDNLLDMMATRFRNSDDMSGFTTGRSDLWMEYLNALVKDAKLVLMGKGFTNVKLGERSSHNTILQSLYQFGILGTVFVAVWIAAYIRGMKKNQKRKSRIIDILILLSGIFLPWMAIDMLFFDEFFLMPMYMMAGVHCLAGENGAGKNKSVSLN